MKANLTVKERKFWKAYVETNSLSESAKRAGSKGTSVSSLATMGRNILTRIEPSLPEILDAMGCDDTLIAHKTLEGLYASRKHFFSYEGRVTDERETDDYMTRAKYLELLARFKGKLIDKHEISGKDGGDLVLQVVPKLATKKNTDLEIE